MPKVDEVRTGVQTVVKTGVYCFYNKVNGKRYVGSAAKSLKDRRTDHLSRLRGNYHCNIYFQRAFNKHGEDAFEYGVLEYALPDRCVEREQFWIDHYRAADPKHGYNRSPVAGSTLGYRQSEETRRKVGEASRGRKHTEDTKRRISERLSVVMLGNTHFKGKVHTIEAKEKIAEASRKQWQNEVHKISVSEKIARTLTGRKLSQESLTKRTLKQRAGLIARNKSKLMRSRISATLKGHTVTEETREKISLSLRKRAKALRLQQGQSPTS